MAPILHSELCASGQGMDLGAIRARMEAEYAHALREKLPVLFLRADAEGIERLSPFPDHRTLVLRSLVELLAGLPRGGELIACRDDAGIAVLLPGTPFEAADLLCHLWIDGAKKLPVVGATASVRASLCIGIAAAQSGSTYALETLRRVACDGLAVASQRGGECCVHSELYDLHQKSVERERPELATAAPVAPPTPSAQAVAPTPAAAAPPPPKPSPEQAARAAIERLIAKHRPASATPFEPTESAPAASLREELPKLELAQEALQELLSAIDAKHKGEVSQLERRIAKLAHALEVTEDELRRLLETRPDDSGLSSAYRNVQGMSLAERNREQKLALLAQILRANLDLRDQLRAAH
jgi:hypothetical protein